MQYRAKQQSHQILQQRVVDLEALLKTKTEGDMTMKEVIERVRKELND
jgi:hypothetical protein